MLTVDSLYLKTWHLMIRNGVCYRATYIVDPDGIIQHVSVNALDTGRNAMKFLELYKH